MPDLLRSKRFSREPYTIWKKKGFVRNPYQTGRKRDARLADVPTLYEVMDGYEIPEAGRRQATVILANGTLGRPIFTSPGKPADRVKLLREAFGKMIKDPAFLEEVNRMKKFELDPDRRRRAEGHRQKRHDPSAGYHRPLRNNPDATVKWHARERAE